METETTIADEQKTVEAPAISLDDLLAAEQPPMRWDEVVIGTLAEWSAEEGPKVDFPGNPARQPLVVRATVRTTTEDVGREAALMFEQGDPRKPLLLGLIQQVGIDVGKTSAVTAEADGERLVLTADREIVLKCGKASITLTRAGKILLRGAYLSSRSSGVNRIKGGSVQIN